MVIAFKPCLLAGDFMFKHLRRGLSLVLLFVYLAGAEEPSAPQPSLWSNVGHELLGVAGSPVDGTFSGYLMAAGFGGALYLGLQHDLDWYRAVQDRRDPYQDKIMPVLTLCGDGWFEVGTFAALYQFGDPYAQQVAAQAVEGQINVALLSMAAKLIFSATRPSADDTQRLWFTGTLGDSSFPSGHSMSIFCSAAILGRAYNAEWLTFPLAAAVAYSRIYNQKHWPADTIAGAGLGTLIGYAVATWHEQLPAKDPAIRFTAAPTDDGTMVMVTWRY